MATQAGTATDWLDLYSKLRDFLTTDTTLVADSQNWTQIAGSEDPLTDSDEIVLQGPGTAGTDEILVGIKPYFSVGLDYYNLALVGMTIYNPAFAILDQVNNGSTRMLHLWNLPIDYWFIANGRRFIVIARVSNVYQVAYGGFLLPYVRPSLWPYPMFVGGCSGATTARWSEQSEDVGAFFNAAGNSSTLLFPDVLWRTVRNRAINNSGEGSIVANPYYHDTTQVRENLDGSYTLDPVVIACGSPYDAQLGRLEGVYRVSGFGNTAENTITIGDTTYLVVPDTFRNTWADYAAFALE